MRQPNDLDQRMSALRARVEKLSQLLTRLHRKTANVLQQSRNVIQAYHSLEPTLYGSCPAAGPPRSEKENDR